MNVTQVAHFLNLRPLRHFSERFCFGTSCVANAVLAVLLIRERNEVMRPYSRVLLLNCFLDCLYTVVCMIVEVEIEINEGYYIFVINGLPKDWPYQAQVFAVACWNATISITGFVASIEFIFRYFLVVKGRLLNIKQILGLCTIVALCSLADAVCYALACVAVPQQQEMFGRLMDDPMWVTDGHPPVFIGADKDSMFFKAFVAIVTVCDVSVLIIMALTSLATLKALKSSRFTLSPKVKKMQAQMNRIMLAEAISLIAVALTPMAVAMVLLVFQIKFVGFALVLGLVATWIPMVNPN
ncbi:hypothetical protein AAVH_17791 [Aphelenchoides avenae]|nr:hypothetical protein AAVH_17791 [Aphelenchus avenae]